MSIFPKITHIDDIYPHVEGKEYIGHLPQKNGTVVLCYNVSNSMSFSTGFEKECRGITFADDGQIIARSMHKFFNLNEREGYQIGQLDWSTVHAVYDKMDGSMINTGLYKGEIFAKSKKSFTSPVAVGAKNYIDAHSNYHEFCIYCAENGLTPTFEFTSPEHRIVLDYKEEALTVLQIREMVSGRYLTIEEMTALTEKFGVVLNKPIWFGDDFDIHKAIEVLSTADEMEGYVIQFKNGDMVKVKSQWYVNLHHAVTFVRERDIAQLVLEETIDDFIAFIKTNRPGADLTRIVEINDEITTEIETLESSVKKIVDENQGLTPKELNEKMKGSPLHNFVMRTFRGQTFDYLNWYRMHKLKDWSLKPVEMGVNDFHTNDEKKE